VQLQQLGWDFYKVLCYRMGFAPGGLYFQRRNILSPDLECILKVLNRHGTVLDLFTADDPRSKMDN
jgi:hypothetical protein